MRKARFGNLMAKECKALTVRLPDEVLVKIESLTGLRPTAWLTNIAMATFAGSKYEVKNQVVA